MSMRQWMKERTARVVAVLFGLSLLLTACDADSVLEPLADLAPRPAAADDGGAGSEGRADASEQWRTPTQPSGDDSSESSGDEPYINPNEHIANLRIPETSPELDRERTEKRPDPDTDEADDASPAPDDAATSEEPADQPDEPEETAQPRDSDSATGGNEKSADAGDESGDLSSIEQKVFDLLNAARRAAGLSPLRLDDELSQGSRAWSGRMATEGFFEHDTGGNFAENIAYGYPTAAAVHRGWMESDGHRDNRMNGSYTRYGIGVYERGDTLYYTERFQ
jgi:uncharacterized protein YkwD